MVYLTIRYLLTTCRRTLALAFVVIIFHLFLLYWAAPRLTKPIPVNRHIYLVAVDLLGLSNPITYPPKLSAPKQALSPAKEVSDSLDERLKLSSHAIRTPSTAVSVVDNDISSIESPGLPVKLPPSAELTFSTQIQRNSDLQLGISRILWLKTHNSYLSVMDVHTQDPLFPRLISEGKVDQHRGLIPDRVSRDHGLAESVTRDELSHVLGSDSNSVKAQALNAYVQDSLSVFWQLAGIGLHDNGTFLPRVEFQMLVAEPGYTSVWRFNVVALEDLNTPIGKLQAWHLIRRASSGTTYQTIELWLAPDHSWYPVKLRYHDNSGDIIELLISDITQSIDT